MMHSRSVELFGPSVSGTNDYADTAGSECRRDYGGLPRKPGMTRDDLLAANSAIVRSVVAQVLAASPDAIIVCVTNPLDVMTYLAWNVSGLPTDRIFGMGGVLDSARFAYAIAEATGAPILGIDALAWGRMGTPWCRYRASPRSRAPAYRATLRRRRRRPRASARSSAARKSSRYSRPGVRSTRLRPPSSAWSRRFSAIRVRHCRAAFTCPVSTAWTTFTCQRTCDARPRRACSSPELALSAEEAAALRHRRLRSPRHSTRSDLRG